MMFDDDFEEKVEAELLRDAKSGITLRDHFAGQALANPVLCTGTVPEYELRRWFGHRGGITRAEIVAAQAGDYADAMLAARTALKEKNNG